jgi:flagellar hook-associated protein 1 FlgK
MSLNGLLNTSYDSLQGFQFAIDLTGANIANVNTPGYSRQRTVFQAEGTADVAAVRTQIGVQVAGVERIYDAYLNNQVAEQSQVVGYSSAKNDVLDRVEGIFAENGGAASDMMNRFWNAWSGLGANPQGQVERENLQAAAQDMTAKFRSLDSDLARLAQDTGENIANTVDQVNDYLVQIADLNQTIVANGARDNGSSNIMKDQRSALLTQLSGLVDMNYIEDSNGAVNIFLANGKPLILGTNTYPLAMTQPAGAIAVVYLDDQNENLNQTLSQGSKGKLAAFLETANTIVPDYQEKLDAVAAAIIAEVNSRHQAGYDNYGNVGSDFFTPAAKAGNFQVSAAVSSDVNKIAASATVNGDGDNALALGAIKDQAVMSGLTATISDNYSALVGRVGRDAAYAKSSLDHQTAIMDQLSNRRESTSGVSLDEEMMNLMKYQMAYNASGKLVTTASQMMDTLMGLVKG